MLNKNKNFEEIIKHLKNMGFVYQGSLIYGGLSNTWDYGHLAILMIQNIKKIWWNEFINKEPENIGIDTKILLNPKVWKSSGHIDNFSDYFIENKINNKRYRIDKMLEKENVNLEINDLNLNKVEKWIYDNLKFYDNTKTNWTKIKKFNLLFETFQGISENNKLKIYLRPEIAQGIFINFLNFIKNSRKKIPFGVGQIGKSFRNEITPGNFIFRTREFEQMELEYFVEPENDQKAFDYYLKKIKQFIKILGIKKNSIRERKHLKTELAHYSRKTIDIEFEFPFGWGELLGISNRGNYDLKMHSQFSENELIYFDSKTNEKYIPHVIEPSIGLDRILLAILIDSYEVEKLEKDSRIVLKLNKNISPFQLAVLPLNKKIHSQDAKKIFINLLNKNLRVSYDEKGSIGKRYRKQDAIGTPFVITVFDETIKKNLITIRFRDSMKQITINFNELDKYI